MPSERAGTLRDGFIAIFVAALFYMSQCPLNGRGRCGNKRGATLEQPQEVVSMPSERAGTLREKEVST